jgi:hypothetical protein
MFFKQMAILYGTAIERPSLRYAILANAASRLPSAQFQNAFHHYKAQACCALRSKMNPQSRIDEGDLFAAFVLSWTHSDDEERVMHVNGCIRMLQVLSAHARTNAVSDVFVVFEPFVKSHLPLYVATTACDWEPALETTFKERLRYWVELFRAANIAIRDAQWTRYTVLRITLRNLAFEAVFALYCILVDDEESQRPQNFLEYMRVVLGDPDLQQSCRSLQSSGEHDEYQMDVSGDMATLELSEAILMAPDVLQGLSSPPITDLARNHISYIRETKIRSCLVRDFVQSDLHCVALAAVALPLADIADCERLDFPQANFSFSGWMGY